MTLAFYHDTVSERHRIERAIKTFGYAAEHNYWWYQYYQYYYEPPQKNVFVESDCGALLTAYNLKDNTYFVVFDPLAAPEHRIPLLMEYIEWIFGNTSAKKIWLQLEKSMRPAFLRALPPRYRPCRIYYTLVWPIMDFRQFDPSLPGGHYKTLRKEMHKFYRDHTISVTDAKRFEDRQVLHTIVDSWKGKRPNHERGMTGIYHQLIDGGFQGTDEARVFMVDGRPVGFNAGWMIPNSKRFYAAVGVHDYSIDDVGTALYLEDLAWLKGHGHEEADMGGGETSLTAFKNKFCPASSYRSDIFSVVNRSRT